jgi:2-hydroxychromene-2-carboxylate isomerase
MDQSDPIEFWFSLGSTYTYLTVMRLPALEKAADVAFRWRPFSVRRIMIEMDNIPRSKPVKFANAWRDVERRAAMYGFPFRERPPYPLKNFDLANRIAAVGAMEGWCGDYVREAYRGWFLDGKEAGSEPNNSEALSAIGQDSARVVALAESQALADAYKVATDEARTLGIFGSPNFLTHGELFWGDDRLEDAIRWHKHGTLAPR